jgi:diaminohydroxyphosphoribosylaminopyrimidine deaminase / 5-amino-6-(5-phosphoribosylamino)uracil reductase
MSEQTAPASEMVSDDERFMRLALALGRRNLGHTWPNPAVGAVIVKDGIILARGWTQQGGRPHAEVEALRRAKKTAEGATMYVTLEPCSHQGKTPPCADAIVRAGIARVVSALEDPNPEVSGQGHERLRAKGVAVDIGLGAEEARRTHAGHIMRTAHGRPHVMLKLAISADGKAGLAGRKQALITGERCHPGRYWHGVVRRPTIDVPSAWHVRTLSGARSARRKTAPAVGNIRGCNRARNADLGFHLAQAIRDCRRNSSAKEL